MKDEEPPRRLTDEEVERLLKDDPVGFLRACSPPWVDADYGDDPPCEWCGEPATALCDGVIVSRTKKTRRPYLRCCSAPMCDAHAKRVGTLFICGPEGEHLTIDYCPTCAPYQGHRDFDGGPPVGGKSA